MGHPSLPHSSWSPSSYILHNLPFPNFPITDYGNSTLGNAQTKNTGSILHSPLHFIPYIQSSRTPFVFIFKLYTESDHYSPPTMLPPWPKPPSCLSGLLYHLSDPPASSLDPLISNTVKNVGQMTFPRSLELTSYITQSKSTESYSNLHDLVFSASCPSFSDFPSCYPALSSLCLSHHHGLPAIPQTRQQLSCLRALHLLLLCLPFSSPDVWFISHLLHLKLEANVTFLVRPSLDF